MDAHTQDPSLLPNLRIVLLTHYDRLIVHNGKDLVLPLPMRIDHSIDLLPMEFRGKYLGAIGWTIMIGVWTHWTLMLLLQLHLLGIIWKEISETLHCLPRPTLGRHTEATAAFPSSSVKGV